MKNFSIYHTNDIHSHFDKFTQIQSYFKQNVSSADWILDAGDFADAKHIAVAGTQGAGATAMLMKADYDALAIGNNEYFQGIGGIMGLSSGSLPVLSCNLVYEDASTIQEIYPYIISVKNDIRLLIIGISPYGGGYSDFLTLMGLNVVDPVDIVKKILDIEQNHYDYCLLLSHAGINQDRILANELEGINIIIGGHSHTLMDDVEKINHTYIHQSGCYGNYIGRLDIIIDDEKMIHVKAQNIVNSFESDSMIMKELEYQTQLGRVYYDKTLYTLDIELDYSPVRECKIMNALCDILHKQYPCDFALMHHGILTCGIDGTVSKSKLLDMSPSPLNPTMIEVSGRDIITAIQQSFNEEFCMQEGKGAGFRGTCLGALAVSSNVCVHRAPLSIAINGVPIQSEKRYCIITDDYLQRGTGYTSLYTEHGTYFNGYIRDVLETGLCNHDIINSSAIQRFY